MEKNIYQTIIKRNHSQCGEGNSVSIFRKAEMNFALSLNGLTAGWLTLNGKLKPV